MNPHRSYAILLVNILSGLIRMLSSKLLLKAKLFWLRIDLKFEKLLSSINRRLPQIMRVGKVGLLTTVISVILGTSTVLAANPTYDTNIEYFSRASYLSYVTAINTTFEGEPVYDPDTQEYKRVGGLLSTLTQLQAKVFQETDQVSGVRYVADTLESAKIAPPVYAQATGYTTLQPVLRIWRVARDLSLGLMVAMGLVVALMILLRVRSGQGYVTLVTGLPKIIVAIVLIIFSYSIAGFMVDLGNIMTRLVTSDSVLYNEANESESLIHPNMWPDINQGGNILYPYDWEGAHNTDFSGPGDPEIRSDGWKTLNVFRLMAGMINFTDWGCEDGSCQIVEVINTPTGMDIVDGGVSLLEDAGGFVDVTAETIIDIYLAIIAFKILFMLVQAFSELLLRSITGPFVFLGIPFQGFSPVVHWVRETFGAVLVFPVTLILLFIAAYFSNQIGAPWYINPDDARFEFAPEMLTHTVDDVGFVGKLLGIGIISILPNVKSEIEKRLQISPLPQQATGSLRNIVSKVPVIGAAASMLGV